MLIRYGYEIGLTCLEPTPVVCVLTVRPERSADIQTAETLIIKPKVPATTYSDSYGNVCRRFVAPAGHLSIWSDSVIADSGLADPVNLDAAEIPVPELPADCLLYLMGSRYCDTDKLSQIAWDMFGGTAPGWRRVQAICDFVNSRIVFGHENARSTRSAFEAYQERTGVCRDYAHLAIALCRCMNIPARYVTGYLGDIGVPIADPMDFSAWMEVYLEGGWATFDPRNNIPRIGRIKVAHGRDAADVPLINSFGPHILNSFRVWTYDVTSISPPMAVPAPAPAA